MEHALIGTPIASLMTQPRRDCELADEALYGMEVELLEALPGGWYSILTPYRYRGYLHEDSLLFGQAHLERWRALPKKLIDRQTADILAEPKVQGACLLTLPRGGLVAPTGEADQNGWVPVALCDGSRGYTKEGFLREYPTDWDPAREEDLREAFAQDALSYLGAQYRWGGKTPLGIDCSGLCSQVYLMNGVTIYRDAHIKPEFAMHAITREEMKKGDLLFFKGHVALYLGEDRFVHATGKNGSDGVVVNSLNPSHPDYREDLAKGILEIGSIF